MNTENRNWFGAALAVVLLVMVGGGFFLFSHTFAAGGSVHTSANANNGSSTFAGNIATLADISMVSTAEGWAVGANNAVATGNTQHTAPIILHYTAGIWKTVKAPDLGFEYNLAKVIMVSATEGWAWGQHDLHAGQALLHYSNGQWQSIPLTAFGSEQVLNFKVFSDGQLWALGTTHQFIFTGKTWQTFALPDRPNEKILALTLQSTTEGWAISEGTSQPLTPVATATPGIVAPTGVARLLHLQNGAWDVINTLPVAQQIISSFTMSDSNNGWVALNTFSTKPTLWHLQNGKWQQDIPTTFSDGLSSDAFVMQAANTAALLYTSTNNDQYLLTDDGKTVQSLLPATLNGQPTAYYSFRNMAAAAGDLWLVGTLRSNTPVTFTSVVAHYHAGTWEVSQPLG